MHGNTYIQNAGGMLGQYGANEVAEPGILWFDEAIESSVRDILGDQKAQIFIAEA